MNRISPTAFFTAYFWHRLGFSPPEFITKEGAIYYWGMYPFDKLSKWLGAISLEETLYARHALIDHLITEAIEKEGYTQVLEVAAGLSSRGYRFTNKYPELAWIEFDLRGMSLAKRRLLKKVKIPANLKFVSGNVLDSFQDFYHSLGKDWDNHKKTLLITEGLINYLAEEEMMHAWKNFAGLCKSGMLRYISDIHPQSFNQSHPLMSLGGQILGFFVKGEVLFHFHNQEELRKAMDKVGFTGKWYHPSKFSEITKVKQGKASPIRIIDAIKK